MNLRAQYILALALSGIPAAAQSAISKADIPAAPSATKTNMLRFSGAARIPSRSLPDAPSSAALTSRQKFAVFMESAGSPLTLAGAGLTAMTMRSSAPNGASGSWSRAYTFAVAQRESNEFFGKFVFPTLLHQDPRYHPADSESFFGRAFYAASRVAITRTDDGSNTVNSSYLLSTVLTSTLANAYRPQWARSASTTMGDIGSTIGGDAGFNLLREFWPQISKKLASKTPKKLKRLAKRFSDQ